MRQIFHALIHQNMENKQL